MSWFSELAGKAENILNKIDQNAANVLKNETEQKTEENFILLIDSDNEKTQQNTTTSSIKRTFSSNSLKLLRTPKKLATTTSVMTTNADVEANKNDENSSEQNAKQYLTPLTNVAPDDLHLSSKSNASNSSRRSSCSSRTDGPVTVIEYPIAPDDVHKNNGHVADIMSTSVLSNSSVTSSKSQPLSTDEKTELSALKIILAQVKSEREQYKSEIDHLTKQVANSNADTVIADLEETCNQLATENENLNKKLSDLMLANNEYIKSISELELTIAKHRQTENELTEKLDWTKSESEQIASELHQYRARAQHTLQMKDQLIEELRKSSPKTNSHTDADNEVDTLMNLQRIEFSNYTKEREQLLDEIKLLQQQLEVGKQFILSLENKNREHEQEFNEKINMLNITLKQEKMKTLQLEENFKAQLREMKAVRDEMLRQQTNYSTQLHEKDVEVNRLRSRINQQNVTSASSNNTDERIHSLTQSLVQKQNALESVTAERNAIRIQLEKMDYEHRNTIQLLRQQNLPRIINVNDTDDAKSQVPNFLQENPFDTRVARRVKRAYSSLDAVGIRLGVFMRRYPLIRILVIIYVAVLHLWVMLVLFSSTPT